MKNRTHRVLVLGVALLLLIAVPALAACQPTGSTPGATTTSGEVYKWKMHYYAPPQAVYDAFAVNFTKELKDMSNGRLDFTPYPEGALVPPAQMLDAVKNGTIEMACLGPYFSGVMPVLLLEYGFPGTYRNYEDMVIHHTMFGFSDIQKSAYDKYGVVYLGPSSPDGGYVLTSRIPITKVEDFKGYKVRATAAAGEVLKALGASVVTTPGSELYTAAATGVIDGVIYGGAHTALDQMKLGEVMKYIVMPFFLGAHGPNNYVVNKAKWASLPPDLQAIIRAEVVRRTGDWYPEVRYADIKTVVDMQKKGLQINQLPDSEFAKIAAVSRDVLNKMVADKKDADFTAGAKSLEDFMKWRGYWT